MAKTHTALCDDMRDHQYGCICGAWYGREPSDEPFLQALEADAKATPKPIETRTVPAATLAAIEAVARAAEEVTSAYWFRGGDSCLEGCTCCACRLDRAIDMLLEVRRG